MNDNLKTSRIYEIVPLFIIVSTLFLIPPNQVFGKPPCDSSSDANLPIITLDPIPSKIYAGETVMFTGQVQCKNGIPYSNTVIEIIQDDFIDQQSLVSGFTNSQGRFSIPWTVKAVDIEKDLDIKAKFVIDPVVGSYLTTKNQKMTVLRGDSSITLNQFPKSAEIGQSLIFSGTLQLQYGSTEGHVVYIKDEDPLESDDLLATGYVNSDGSYSANWIVTNVDDDRIADIYVVFEGANTYHRVTTCDIGHTSTLGGSCQNTIKLQITGEIPPPPVVTTDSDNDGIDDFYDQCKNSPEIYNGYQDSDGCPDTTPSKPSTKEVLNGNEYMDLYYSHNFEKNPLVAIVPDPDSYDKVKVYLITAQEGIRIWESELQKKFGSKWNIDFEIIDPRTKFDKKPDIIMNLVTRDTVAGCGKDFGGLAYVSTMRPVNTIVCTNDGNSFYGSNQVAHTSAHEFIHAMGLGHVFNKVGDLMCSVEGGKPTCGNQIYASSTSRPSDFNLAAVGKLYGKDGFLNPNSNILYGTRFTTSDYVNDDYSIMNKDESLKPQVTKDSDLDGILDNKDQCIYQKETLNGYKDFDGCPDTKPITTDTWKAKTLKLQTDVNKKIESLKTGVYKAKDSLYATNFKNSQAKKELDKAWESLWWAKKYLGDAEKTQKEGEKLISKLKFQEAYYKYQYSMTNAEKINKYLFDITKYISNAKKLEK